MSREADPEAYSANGTSGVILPKRDSRRPRCCCSEQDDIPPIGDNFATLLQALGPLPPSPARVRVLLLLAASLD